MALKTDSLLSISSNGVEYDKIGLSKTLNNYTFDELFNSVYCSADSNLIYHVASGGDITYYDYQDSPDNGHIPVKLTPVGQNRSAIYFPNDNPINMPDGLYFRVIWLQRTRSGYDSYINKDKTGQFYKAITMLDSRHYVWECNPPTKQNNNYGANSWDAEDNLYCSESGKLYYYDDIKSANPTRIVVSNVIPAIIFKFNNHNYILPYIQKMSYFFTKDNTHNESSYNPKTAKYCYDYDNSNPIAFPITTEQIYNHFNSSTGEFSSPIAEGSYISLGSSGYPSNGFSNTLKEHVMSIYSFGGNTSYDSYFGFSVYNYFKTKHECIKFWALGGLYIKADKIYKPIIKDGYVSDFTEDLNTESDIDNWTGDTNHKVPDESPGGSGDDDDDSDDINFGYAFSGAGAFTNLWYCTQKDLADLRQWFLGADAQHPIPEGFDPMPSIIGLFQYPISLGGDVLEEIKFRTSSGLIVSTGVQAARGLSTNLKFDLGSINIPARMRERGVPFLDYESTVECYVPFCGVFQLDTQTVIGKTLSCTLWMSPATGECNCIVYTISNGIKAPVAYGSGNMSSQIPISSNGWGSYAAALKNATVQKNQILTGALTGEVSSLLSGSGNMATTLELGEQIAGISMGKSFGAAGLALGGAGAALGMLSTGIKAYQDINAANVGIRHLKASNGTSINGAFSGQSAWNYPMTPYVKISRPHYKKPSNYAHTQGIPLVEAKKLSECSGFTMCVGADLTGITATQTERDIISAYLTNGIIV